MDRGSSNGTDAPSSDTSSLGATIADKMLTMVWSVSGGWTSAVIRPFGPIPLFPTANVLHYGLSVFEALKAHSTTDGHVALFRAEEHIARLNQSARRLTLPEVPQDFVGTLTAYVGNVRAWVPRARGSSLYLRIVLFGSEPRLGVRPSHTAVLVIMASPMTAPFSQPGAAAPRNALRLKAYPHFSRAAPGGIGACKTGGNYAAAMYPTELAKEEGFDQVLWLSDASRKLVTEAGVMNVFFVFEASRGGKLSLVTPRKDGTILDGITRRSIIALAMDMGIDVQERDVPIDEVFQKAHDGSLVQIFGTGTATVVCPIASIECDGHVAELSPVDEGKDLAGTFRNKLLRIFEDSTHPWTVRVPEHQPDCKVLTSAEPSPADDIHSWW